MLKLEPEQIDIWSFTYTDNLYKKLQNYTSILSHSETLTAKSFKYENLRKKYILFHMLLRILLSKYLTIIPAAIVFGHNKYGKPFIYSNPLEFNISHSKNQLIIGIGKSELGVDIEFIDGNYPISMVIEDILHRNEKNKLNTLSTGHQEYFFKLWTRKEALLKAIGNGLNGNLCQLDLSLREKVFMNNKVWVIKELDLTLADYVGCVTVSSKKEPLLNYLGVDDICITA